jgi:KH domain
VNGNGAPQQQQQPSMGGGMMPQQQQQPAGGFSHYGGPPPMSGGGGGHYGSGGGDELVFNIDNAVVGVVIGRGGENIQRIQRDFNISIQITKAQDLPPGSTTRPVTLKGEPGAIAAAKAEIDNMLDQRNTMGAAAGLIVAGSGSHYGSGGASIYGGQPQSTLTMAIPNDRVSLFFSVSLLCIITATPCIITCTLVPVALCITHTP